MEKDAALGRGRRLFPTDRYKQAKRDESEMQSRFPQRPHE